MTNLVGVAVHVYRGFIVFMAIGGSKYFAGPSNRPESRFGTMESGGIDGIHTAIDNWISNGFEKPK